MITDFTKQFDKILEKITNVTLLEKIEEAIKSVENAVMKKDIPKLKKLKGYKIHYRIRVGRYRIGITIENDLVTFFTCLPRKEFYRRFP